MIDSYHTRILLNSYEADLQDLLSRLSLLPRHYSYIGSIMTIFRKIAGQLSLLDSKSSDDIAIKKNLNDAYQEIYLLLVENNHYSTHFTDIVDRYCHHADSLKKRLHQFLQFLFGPEIKLFQLMSGDHERYLAVKFPNQEMCDILLEEIGMKEFASTYIDSEDNTIVRIPAFKADNQQLAVKFPSVKIKNNFIHILNLSNPKIITSGLEDCHFCINDRRIHDIASRFYISILCPYFIEYYKIKYGSHMLAQAQRDTHGFFSLNKLPQELILKIASNLASSDAINVNEKVRVAGQYLCRP